jgi:hypothetical protein
VNYDHNYQYDPLGNVNALNCAWAANVFQAQGAHKIRGVGFYTEVPGASYTINVYRNPSPLPVGGSPVATATGSFPYAGYHTVQLPTPVSVVAGDTFSVSIYIVNGGSAPLAVEFAVPGWASAATASPGQSYYSSNGSVWWDLTTLDPTANFCIKAFADDNTPPSAPTEVRVMPTSPLTTDIIIASATGGSDPDGDSIVGYRYQWSSNSGAGWSAWGNEGQTLPAASTSKGQQWKARAAAFDGSSYGDWLESATVTIGNTGPTAPTSVNITPSAPTSADNLTATPVGATDPDTADTLSYEYQWSSDDGGGWNAWADGSGTLDASNTIRGEQWKAQARTFDGTVYSGWMASAPVTIGNAPPSAPTALLISPTEPETIDDLSATAGGSNDPDLGDSVSYVYQWSSNSGSGWSAWGYDGATLSSSNTAVGQQWKARARGYDGTDYGDWLESDPIAIHGVLITAGPSGNPNPVYSGEQVACSVTASDTYGHDLVYAWSAEGGAGSFDNAAAAAPVWTAPVNATQSVQEYDISVTVTCSGDPTLSATASYTQQVDPIHEVTITTPASGTPNPVESGGTVQCSVAAADTLPHTLTYSWSAEGGAGSFDDPTTQNPIWTAPANSTQTEASYEISVTVTCPADSSRSVVSSYTQRVSPRHEVSITSGPSGIPNPVYSGEEVQCSAAAIDTLAHALQYQWTAEGDAGSFDDPTVQNPIWTAPENRTGTIQEYDITVTVSCATDGTVGDTATYTQRVEPVHEVEISAGPSGDPNPVESGEQVQCSVTAADTFGHAVLYQWSAEGDAGSFSNATARTPIWTAPVNNTQSVQEYDLTVTVSCSGNSAIKTTATFTQQVNPIHEVSIAAGPSGAPNAVYSGEQVQCSVTAADTLPHGLIYQWTAEGDAGSFDDATAQNPIWTAPTNSTQDVHRYEITCTVTCAVDPTVSATTSYTQRVSPLHEVAITELTGSPNPVYSGQQVQCSVTATDTLSHNLRYQWTAEGDAGSFNNAAARNPIWTAPVNSTGTVQEYDITCTVTCAVDDSEFVSDTYTQQVTPTHEVNITDGPSGAPNPVYSEGQVQCGVTASDTLSHGLVYQWSAQGDAGSFNNASAQNPIWTAPANSTQSVQQYEITCTVTCATDGTVSATASYIQNVSPLHEVSITAGPAGDPNPVYSGGQVQCSVTGNDTLPHALEYQWSAQGGAGSFSDATAPNPVWTAPENSTQAVQEYEITVTVTCPDDPTLTDTESYTQRVLPVHAVQITEGPVGDRDPIYSAGQVQCSVTATDTLPHALEYLWTAEGDAGSFDDPTAQNPIWTAPTNNTQIVQEYEITVTVTCPDDPTRTATATYVQRVTPVHEVQITEAPSSNENPVDARGTVDLSVVATDTLGHDLIYAWTAEGDAGSFSDPSLRTPRWTAPANGTETVQEYEITVTVTCSLDPTRTATASFIQQVAPMHEVTITAGPAGDPNPVDSGGEVQCSVAAEDSFSHELSYQWTAENGAGSFDDATAQNPIWTAPANNTQSVQEYEITAVVTCTTDPTRSATASFVQQVAPLHELAITAGPESDQTPVYSGGTVQCSVTATDTLPHALIYNWTAAGDAGTFSDPSADNPTWTAPVNETQDVQQYEITVTVTCAEDAGLTETASFMQRVSPVHEVTITQGPTGETDTIASGGQVQCSVTGSDTLGHGLLYAWWAEGGAGSFDDATAQNPTWTAPANNTEDVQEYEINVTVTCGDSADVTATASFVQRVEPYYGIEITAGPAGDPNPVVTGGRVLCSVTAADSRGEALQYLWTAVDAAGTNAGSFDNPASRTPTWNAPEVTAQTAYTIEVTVTSTIRPEVSVTDSFEQQVAPALSHLFGPGLQMVGLPIEPAQAASMRGLLGADRVALWDAAQQAYTADRTDQWAAGAACWALFPMGTHRQVKVPGTPYGEATYNCAAGAGWNQVALPWNTEIPMAALSAEGIERFHRVAWTYYDGAYHLVADIVGIPRIDTVLEPWRSYWVYAGADCTLTMLNGIVPADVTPSLELPMVAEGDWLIQLVASTSRGEDAHNYCGVNSERSGTLLPNPPPVDGSVDLFFTPTDGTMAALELASPTATGSYEWDFSIAGAESGQEVSVSCPDLSGIPGTHSIYLQDRDADRLIYLRTCPAYSYTSAAAAPRHFTLIVRPRTDLPVTISSVQAMQSSSGTAAMQFSLSADATVDVEVMNIAGRSVRQLLSGAAMASGLNIATWNLRGGDGTAVPSGIYLIRIVARDDDGAQVRSLTTLRVDR